MKKHLLVLVVLLLMVSVPVFVQAQNRISTDGLAADTLIRTSVVDSPSGFCGLIVAADGTNAATATVYDNTSGSGKKLGTVVVAAGEYLSGFVLPYCVDAITGIYLDVGTNTTAWVHWVR